MSRKIKYINSGVTILFCRIFTKIFTWWNRKKIYCGVRGQKPINYRLILINLVWYSIDIYCTSCQILPIQVVKLNKFQRVRSCNDMHHEYFSLRNIFLKVYNTRRVYSTITNIIWVKKMLISRIRKFDVETILIVNYKWVLF